MSASHFDLRACSIISGELEAQLLLGRSHAQKSNSHALQLTTCLNRRTRRASNTPSEHYLTPELDLCTALLSYRVNILGGAIREWVFWDELFESGANSTYDSHQHSQWLSLITITFD